MSGEELKTTKFQFELINFKQTNKPIMANDKTSNSKGEKKTRQNNNKGTRRSPKTYSKDNSKQDASLNDFIAPANTPATYSLITGENTNSYTIDVSNNNISYDTLLMQTVRMSPFGAEYNSNEPQSLFAQEQFQSALNIATRRTVSYKINNSWKDHFTYFDAVVKAIEIYYSLDSIIRFTDNPASKNATLNNYRNTVVNSEVLDRHKVLGRLLETCFLPKELHEYIFNVFTLRLSGVTGNSTVIGYTALDYDRLILPTDMVTRLNAYISDITNIVTGNTNNDVATNLANLITRTDLNWMISIKEMPSVLGYDGEFMNMFMNSTKAYRAGTALLQNFPTGRSKLSYTDGQMNPLTVISTSDELESGIIVPFVTSVNSLSYIKSTSLSTIVRITQATSESQTAMFGTPGFYVSTTAGAVGNVQNLLPGGKLTFGTTGQNRESLINNLFYEMLELKALS